MLPMQNVWFLRRLVDLLEAKDFGALNVKNARHQSWQEELKKPMQNDICKRGHVNPERTANRTCKECRVGYMKTWHEKNREKHLAQSSAWYYANKERITVQYRKYRAANIDKIREQQRRRNVADPRLRLFHGAKNRAKRSGLPFNLTIDDIAIPKRCPALLIPLAPGNGKLHANSPTLDRIQPDLGYVRGNVVVISHKANVMKNYATPEELTAVALMLVIVYPQWLLTD